MKINPASIHCTNAASCFYSSPWVFGLQNSVMDLWPTSVGLVSIPRPSKWVFEESLDPPVCLHYPLILHCLKDSVVGPGPPLKSFDPTLWTFDPVPTALEIKFLLAILRGVIFLYFRLDLCRYEVKHASSLHVSGCHAQAYARRSAKSLNPTKQLSFSSSPPKSALSNS